MSDETILVTGATGSLGRQVVQTFLAGGYRVIGTVIPNESELPEFKHQNFLKIVADLLNDEDTEKAIASTISQIRNIDVAVLTVGGFAIGHIADTTTSGINKQYRLNFETAYNVARPVFSHMQKQNGGKFSSLVQRQDLMLIVAKEWLPIAWQNRCCFALQS